MKKIFSVSKVIGDMVSGHNVAPLISVGSNGRRVLICMKYPGAKDTKFLYYLEKRTFTAFVREADRLIDRYGKHILGRGGLAERVPFDENRKSPLLKFALRKLG